MKKYFLLIIVTLILNSKKSNAQVDLAYDSIAVLNLDHYANLPVDSFLKVIPTSYDHMGLFGVLKNNKIGGLGIHYPSGMQILIKPKQYNFMNPIDANNTWDMSLFKKEKARSILIIHPDYPALSGRYP